LSLSGQIITLTSGQIVLSNSLYIYGTGLSNGVLINGNGTSRIFQVNSGTTAIMEYLTLTNGNPGANPGGAIYNTSGTLLELVACTLAGNSSSQGGAIENQGTCVLFECTLTGNHASGNGGAIDNNQGPLQLLQCTLVTNSASGSGGGVANYLNTLAMTNCIVAGNNSADIYNFGSSTINAGGTNLVQSYGNAGTFNGTSSLVSKAPLLASLGNYGGLTPTMSTVMPKDIEAFLTWRLKSGSAPKTAIVDLKTLNGAFRRAENHQIILKNPVAAVRLPKEVCSEREVFKDEEVQKILNAAPSLEWQTLILLGYFIGARLCDCVKMKWENVNSEDGTIVYQQQKTGKKVTVPMHYHVIERLDYLSTFGTSGYLCPKLASKGPGGKHGLSEGFKRIVVKAGVDLMTVKGMGKRNFSRRTFHSLRHSFNSALANAGVSEEVRKKLTGHAPKGMNSHYTHFQMDILKSAVTTLPKFGTEP
jgi:integrase